MTEHRRSETVADGVEQRPDLLRRRDRRAGLVCETSAGSLMSAAAADTLLLSAGESLGQASRRDPSRPGRPDGGLLGGQAPIRAIG